MQNLSTVHEYICAVCGKVWTDNANMNQDFLEVKIYESVCSDNCFKERLAKK